MSENEIIDGQAQEIGTDLVPAPSTNLFRTDDPVEVVAKASQVADALKGVLDRQQLTVRIQTTEHVKVEGWTTLGSMLGVVPVVEWTRPIENGWEARVEARTLDGRTVGAAEAQCTKDEKRWKTADDYAVRSMAQTRAVSKALRGPLGFIVTLAGYSATPAEEMPRPADVQTQTQQEQPLSAQRRATIYGKLAEAGYEGERLELLLRSVGCDDPDLLSASQFEAIKKATNG